MITRRLVILLVCFALAQPGKPNFLFLQCDSMDGRLLDPRSKEFPAIYAPNLNNLAKTGVNFASTYTHSPQCVPSRASMWTGLRVDQIQTFDNGEGLCRTWVNFTCVDQNITGIYTLWDTPLKEAGYEVSILGRVDMGGDYGGGFHGGDGGGLVAWTRSANITKPTEEGPEVIDNSGDPYAHDYTFTNECLRYLEKYDSDQPFFLHCGTLIPHPGYVTNSTWLNYINQSNIFVPDWQDFNDMHPYDQYMVVSKCTYTGDCSGQNATADEIRHSRALYYATIAQTDAMFGEVIQMLKKVGKYDDTIIIFTSDHGELNMDHRQWLKNSMYEGSTRVPLIISAPSLGIDQGTIVAEHTSLLDIFPTLMELSGAVAPPNLQGDSLVPFLSNPQANSTHKDYVFTQYHSNFGNTGTFMIRQGDWKYIAFGTNPPFQNYNPQLFNVSADPSELNDVSMSFPDIVTKLDALINSIVDYKSLDAYVKKLDYSRYMSWQEDGHQEDYLAAFWEKKYKGFDAVSKAKVEAWVENGPFGGNM